MALEFHIITSQEFFRLGAHGEMDWVKTLAVLSTLAKAFLERGTDLALLDVRDTQTDLSEQQIESLVHVLQQVGLREHHRVAILHRTKPRPLAAIFVDVAREHGFDVAEFVNYEKAVEWLSQSDEEDPEFDRDTYLGPSDHTNRGRHPPSGGPGS